MGRVHGVLKSSFFALLVVVSTPQASDLAGQERPANASQSYALVIGISKYANLPATAQLSFPDWDAREIADVLTSRVGGQFPPDNVHLLVNEEATGEKIRYEIEQWLPSVSKDNDRVLIYYSGHAILWREQGWLFPYDGEVTRIASTAYPTANLGATLRNRIRGKWKVLLTESAHSGVLNPDVDRAAGDTLLKGIDNSVFLLTSSRDRETSFEGGEYNHGVFTYFVLKGLRGAADANADGFVDADELAEYVHTNVRAATKGKQNPTSQRGSYDPHMILAYSDKRSKDLPPPP